MRLKVCIIITQKTRLLLHILFKTLKEKYERQTNEMKGIKKFTKKQKK